MKFNRIVLAIALVSTLSTAYSAEGFWNKIKFKKRATPIELADSTATLSPTLDTLKLKPLQVDPIDSLEVCAVIEEVQEEEDLYNDSLTLNYTIGQMDSLLSVWRERRADEHFEQFRQYYITDDESEEHTSTTPDSVYISRLRDLLSPVTLPYNQITKSYISRYTSTRYGTINRIMSLSQYYFPEIEEELLRHDIPIEFRAMPIIESALSATAVSPAGAVGLWQFMPATGKAYGLEINSLVDERCDPILSTKAACKFLNDMYSIYGDWTLVIAAYNCGPGNVNKALARSGVDKSNGTFWDIYYHLPRETRGYVPAFVGASYAYAYHQQHNITFEESPLPLATDTIHINKIMHFGQISEVLEIPIELLRELNPQYRKDIIPAITKEYPLRLPQSYVGAYILGEELIMAKDSTYLKEYINPEAVKKAMATPSFTIHTVRKGDTLSGIASKYRVSTRSIIQLNNLRNPDRLSVGQRLKITGR